MLKYAPNAYMKKHNQEDDITVMDVLTHDMEKKLRKIGIDNIGELEVTHWKDLMRLTNLSREEIKNIVYYLNGQSVDVFMDKFYLNMLDIKENNPDNLLNTNLSSQQIAIIEFFKNKGYTDNELKTIGEPEWIKGETHYGLPVYKWGSKIEKTKIACAREDIVNLAVQEAFARNIHEIPTNEMLKYLAHTYSEKEKMKEKVDFYKQEGNNQKIIELVDFEELLVHYTYDKDLPGIFLTDDGGVYTVEIEENEKAGESYEMVFLL